MSFAYGMRPPAKWHRTESLPYGQFRKLAYSDDGKLLAVAVKEGPTACEIKVLDAATGSELHSLAGHRFPIEDISFSPDGRRLASCSGAYRESAGELKLWDLASGRELLKLSATGDSRLAFSPDGRRLYCVSGGYVKDSPRFRNGTPRRCRTIGRQARHEIHRSGSPKPRAGSTGARSKPSGIEPVRLPRNVTICSTSASERSVSSWTLAMMRTAFGSASTDPS